MLKLIVLGKSVCWCVILFFSQNKKGICCNWLFNQIVSSLISLQMSLDKLPLFLCLIYCHIICKKSSFKLSWSRWMNSTDQKNPEVLWMIVSWIQFSVNLLGGLGECHRNPVIPAALHHYLAFFSLLLSFRATTQSCCYPETVCVSLCNRSWSWRANQSCPLSVSWEPYKYQSVTHTQRQTDRLPFYLQASEHYKHGVV